MRKQETGSNKFKEIFKGIQQLIEEDGLQPGDRLLSERELSERLGAGRSTVREVLRSLELLGLISTKRGEGTFLEPYHAHHLVDLLAGFILRDQRSKGDLTETRMLIETGAVRMAVRKATKEQIDKLEKTLARIEHLLEEQNNPKKEVRDFHAQIIRMANNYLLTRIWYPIVHFEEAIGQKGWMEQEYFAHKMLRYYHEIVLAFKKRQELEAMMLFERIFSLMECAH